MNLYEYVLFSSNDSFREKPISYYGDFAKAYHVDYLKLMKKDYSGNEWNELVKASKMYDANNGHDREEKHMSIIVGAIKNSYLWQTVFHGCKSFVIIKQENGQRMTVDTQPDCILLRDFNLYGYNEMPFKTNETLYHTSYISGITKLFPSLGARNKEHSIYDTPRIYCTTVPTSAGGWPLLIGDWSEKAVGHVRNMIKNGEKDLAIKYISKWIVRSEDLHIYQLPRISLPLYPDPEMFGSMGEEKVVFYVKTDKTIPVREVKGNGIKVNLDYLLKKEIVGDFIKEHLPEISRKMKERKENDKVKYNFKLMN